MREFTGKPVGILKPIMGMVTTKSSARRAQQVLLVFQPRNIARRLFSRVSPSRYTAACMISDHGGLPLQKNIPHLLDLSEDNLFQLHDGDIVKIEPSGRVTVVYEANSLHNTIFFTNICNCSCVMCSQPPAKDSEDLLEQNLMLISLLERRKERHLGITGGEPTILAENLIKFIQTCRAELPKTSLTLLTNGRKLQDFEFARALVLSGYPRLFMEIPVYGDNDTEHDSIMGASGSFYETIQGLHNLALLSQPVGLRTVLHSMTIKRLCQYAEFVYRNLPFVVQVAFMGMETTGAAKANLDCLWVDPYDYRHQLESAVRYLNQRKVPVSIYNHQLCTLPKDLWPFARRSISTWKETFLPLCDECYVKNFCCGIFGTGGRPSAFLRPLFKNELPKAWQDN